jgi:hypothetical protein
MIDQARSSTGGQNKFFGYVLRQASNFEEFIFNCKDEIVDGDGRKYIFRNQIDYLTDEDDALIVDFIGKYESLQSDFDTVMARLDESAAALPIVNASSHTHYTDYYTPAMVEHVSRLYARDLDAFGYEFGK